MRFNRPRWGFAWLVFGALALPWPAVAADAKEVRKTVDLAADGRLAIDTFKGSIEVSTWDRPQAEIVARVEPDDSDSSRRQAEKVAETEIRIEGSGASVRVKSDYDRVRTHLLFPWFGHSGTLPFVHYAIRMPRTARLEIHDYKSRTRIAGLAAELEMKTYKGEVEIREMDGPVRLETYKGEVHAEYARFARSEFETYKGSIEVSVPRQTAFSIDADLGRRGDLRNEFGGVERALTSRRWDHRIRDAKVNGGGAALTLRTSKGDLRIRAR